MILALIISAIISYLLGSLNFGIIISKSLNKDDVRSHGSGNAGSTNMLRNYGKKYAVMTIIGDMLKVAVAIFISFIIVRKLGNISLAKNSDAFIFGINARMFTKSFAGLFAYWGIYFLAFLGLKAVRSCYCRRNGIYDRLAYCTYFTCNICHHSIYYQICIARKYSNGCILPCIYICIL